MKNDLIQTKEKSKVDAQISALLDYLINKDELDSANDVLNYLLTLYPDDFWLLTKMSSVYHEKKEYKKALEYSKKALRKAANSPLVLWDYACALDMLGKGKEAIQTWKKIVSFGIKDIAFKKTREGKKWAQSLFNDCFLRIGLSYLEMEEKELALENFKKHLANRKAGMPSIYSPKEMREMIYRASKKKIQELDFAA